MTGRLQHAFKWRAGGRTCLSVSAAMASFVQGMYGAAGVMTHCEPQGGQVGEERNQQGRACYCFDRTCALHPVGTARPACNANPPRLPPEPIPHTPHPSREAPKRPPPPHFAQVAHRPPPCAPA